MPELFSHGTIKRIDGTAVPIHYIHEVGDRTIIAQTGDQMVSVLETQDAAENWRNRTDVILTERTKRAG